MNKEELYKLALSDISKYSLLNEIFAIRDTRFEDQDYTIYANGCISLDVLNRYVNLINQVGKLTGENNDLEEKYIIRSESYNRVLLENADLKDKINTYENPDDLTLMFMYCDEKAKDKIKELQSVIDKAIKRLKGLQAINNGLGATIPPYSLNDVIKILDESLEEILRNKE